MSGKFRDKYRIPSIRLQSWDYSKNGYYFVTICTKNKINYFGEIIDNKIQLSEIGKIIERYWLEIPNHFSFVELDEFVIMPNHIHGILIINNVIPHVETPNLGVSTIKTKHNKWKSGCLGLIINQYKRICTINIRKKYENFFWQPRFYDQIIRNKHSLFFIQKYIRNNPINWERDRNNL